MKLTSPHAPLFTSGCQTAFQRLMEERLTGGLRAHYTVPRRRAYGSACICVIWTCLLMGTSPRLSERVFLSHSQDFTRGETLPRNLTTSSQRTPCRSLHATRGFHILELSYKYHGTRKMKMFNGTFHLFRENCKCLLYCEQTIEQNLNNNHNGTKHQTNRHARIRVKDKAE